MQGRWDAGQVEYRAGEMQDKSDAGNVGCRQCCGAGPILTAPVSVPATGSG